MINKDLFKTIVLDSPDNKDEFFNYVVEKIYPKYYTDNSFEGNELILKDLCDTIMNYIQNDLYTKELSIFILKYMYFFYFTLEKCEWYNKNKCNNNELGTFLFTNDNNNDFHKFLYNILYDKSTYDSLVLTNPIFKDQLDPAIINRLNRNRLSIIQKEDIFKYNV